MITGLAVGGAESMLTSLLTAMRKTRPERHLRVVSLSAGGPNAVLLRDAGIQVTELGMEPDRPPVAHIFRLARLLWLERPELVQSWMYHADLAATMALAWADLRQTTRLYWGLRCSELDLSKYRLRLRTVIGLCRQFSHLPDLIISNSEAGADFHLRLGYRPRKMVVIDNGIDIERFRPNPEARARVRALLGIPMDAAVIAHVARVDPMKDHQSFLRALEALPGVVALAIGHGTEDLPHRPGLFRLGRRSDVPELLAAADVAVSSSAFGEGFSNVIVEAMATGVLVVATDVGDASRILGMHGRIVPPRSPMAMSSAVAELLAKPREERIALGLAARERVQKEFSLQRAVERFEQLYKNEA